MNPPLTLKQRFKLSRFIKGEPSSDLPITLNHRRIFILPSKRGFGFVMLILLLLLVAFVYNNNLTYILGFLLASIFFISILHSFKAVVGLVIRTGKTNHVFAGETALFELHIENPSATARVNLHIKTVDNEPVLLDIAPFSTGHVKLFSKTHKRGRHALGSITIFCYFPFGLFRCWSPVNFDFSTLVYPSPASGNQAYPELSSVSHQQGSNKTGNDDFYGLNDYQKGDSIRRIHWKAYAKGQGLFIKQYSGAAAAEIWLDYASTPGQHMEQRLSQLCRWILDAEQAGINYGLKIPGFQLEPSKGALHYQKCLAALALFGE